MKLVSTNQPAQAVTVIDQYDLLPDANYKKFILLGLLILLIGFGSFMAWALFAPVDEGVPAPGVIAVESKRKRIDHLNGGIVEKIMVREGQKVSAGDILVVLNDAQSKASLNAAESQWRVASVTLARLDAERTGAKQLVFPKEITAAGQDAALSALMKAQAELFLSRRNALQGELAIIRESVRGLETQVRSLDDLVAGRTLQIKLFNEQLTAYRQLFEKSFVSRVQLIEIERQLAEVQTKQSEDLSNIAAVKARLSEFRMRGAQREMEYRREVESQLADVQKEGAIAKERLVASKDIFDRLQLRAPVGGTVVDLAFATVGGVVKPGDKIMEIVPEGDVLIVEGQVPPQYIDRIRAGLPADIHFDAYTNQVKQPVITGKVTTVSADALTDPRSGVQYFSIRVAVPGSELKKLGDFKVQPGMQSTVMVKTGERTMMTYLLRPLFRRFSKALGEN
jgi:HlyD family type I secretion membrane fusion protein